MPQPRKKWATQPPLMKIARRSHPSQAAAYRNVQDWAQEYRDGKLRQGIEQIEVYIDERDGRGWQLYDRVDLAEWAAMTDKESDQ